ncbi:MAG: AraC family transcriptional regulator [Bacteroidales bacterium]|nr:AraC family transcriptional regulator [Bacteroidales bacterium]
MEIRELKAEPFLNDMVRRGYRHQNELGVIMNSFLKDGFVFRIGQPYRVTEGRIMLFLQGGISIEVDMLESRYQTGDVAVVMPDSVVVFNEVDPDCIAHAALFRQLPIGGESFSVGGDKAFFADTLRYFELIFDKLGQPSVPPQVISHLFIAMIADTLSHRPAPHLSPSATLLHRFVQMVNTEGHTKHPAAWYAERLFVSQSHLGAVVRGSSGMTPLQWIDRALIREAKLLLHHTAIPVAEVAEHLGFATPSFFIHFFHKNTGTTPLQFRKQR